MLVVLRKSGQGVEVKSEISDEIFEFDFLYNRKGKTAYRINGEIKELGEKEPFYLDHNAEVMVIVVKIECSNSIRVGVDACKIWNIRRKEVASTV